MSRNLCTALDAQATQFRSKVQHSDESTPLVRLQNVSKSFESGSRGWGRSRQEVRAVEQVSLCIAQGETVGLVGESGCGKSTLGRLILRLLNVTSGRVFFDGYDITNATQRELRPLRRHMQIIFQDPYSSLNPRMNVRQTLGEAIDIHRLAKTRNEAESIIAELLIRVGLKPEMMKRYPHEFSGGQRQRIGIARALAVRPRLIVCDEPISALDVSIQAQIINLLRDLQEEMNLTYLFVSHDLKIVRYMSQRVAVMYLGRIVELASSQMLYEHAAHPYTQALMSAIPSVEPMHRQRRVVLQGEPPNPINPPKACVFHTRCPRFQKGICDVETPMLREIKPNTGHWAACHFAEST